MWGWRKTRAVLERTESREFVNYSDQSTGRKDQTNTPVDQRNQDNELRYNDNRYRSVEKWVRENSPAHRNMSMKEPQFSDPAVVNGVNESETSSEDFTSSFISSPVVERMRFSPSPSPSRDEGPSNHQGGYFHGYREQIKIHSHDLDGPSRVANMEHDRVDLLRKLDELSDELSRSWDPTEKPREMVRFDRKIATPLHPVLTNSYSGHSSYAPEGQTSLYAVSTQTFAPNPYVSEPHYFGYDHGPSHFITSRGLDMPDFYPPPRYVPYVPNEFVGYDAPQRPTPPNQSPAPTYLTQFYHDPYRGHCMDINYATPASYHCEISGQSACPCTECSNRNWPIPAKTPNHNVFQRSLSELRNRVSPYLGGLGERRPRRMVVPRGGKRACHPVAGGAPFITCSGCFGLLKLPRKLRGTWKNQQIVRCGACSNTILIQFQNRNGNSTRIQQVSAEGDDVGSVEMLNEELQSSQNSLDDSALKFSSDDDYHNFGHDNRLADAETSGFSSEPKINFSETNLRQEPLSLSSNHSEHEQSPNSITLQRGVSNSHDLPPEDAPLPFPHSPHQKDPKEAFLNNVIVRLRYAMGNKSNHNGQEQVILDSNTLQHSSAEDVSVATEMGVTCTEFLNSNILQGSMEVRREERPKMSNGRDSSLGGPIKKRRRDFWRSILSTRTRRPHVSVEGQQVSDSVAEKAEKMAGPIQSGNYWHETNWRQETPCSPSSNFSEDEQSADPVILQRDVSNFDDLPPEEDAPLPTPDSPNQEDDPNVTFLTGVLSINAMGNKSKNNGQEKVILDRSTLHPSSAEDVSEEATEMDTTFTESLNSSKFQDSLEVSKNERHSINNGSDSSFEGSIQKSFRDFARSSRSAETGRPNDFVHGQPVQHNVVKKAEKLAGPILPGNYWYETNFRLEPLSPGPNFSEDEQRPDSEILQKDISKSDDLPLEEDEASPLFQDTPHQKDPNDAFLTDVVGKYGLGNKNKHHGQEEKVILDSSTLQRSSAEDVSVATKMDVTFTESSNSRVFQDSVEVSKEEQPKINKGSDSSSGVPMKMSFRNFGRSVPETVRPNDFVNVQPESDCVTKKAEMLADPIQIENCWYETNLRQEPLSPSSNFSEDEQSPDSVILQRDVSNSDDLPPEEDVPLSFPDSPRKNDPNDAFLTDVVSKHGNDGMGDSKPNGQEKVILESKTLPQNSAEVVSVATEVDITIAEFETSGVSQEIVEVSKEKQLRINNGSDSSSGVPLKKSFRDPWSSSQSDETGRPNDFVNEQPVSDSVLTRMAEKLAGHIRPGNSWYETYFMQEPLSPSSNFSEDEQSPDLVIPQRNIFNFDGIPPEDDTPLQLLDSPPQNHLNDGKYGMEKKSKPNGQEKVILDSNTLQQSSAEDVLAATLGDITITELEKSSISRDSAEVSNKERPRINNESDLFPAGPIKKSFRDPWISNPSDEIGETNDFVTGQPVSDRVAGPIKPGNLWYNTNLRQEYLSPSFSFLKDEKIQDSLVLQTDVSKSGDLPMGEDAHLLFPGFPLQKDPNDVSLPDMVSINVMGDISKNNDQEKVILHSSTLQWSSVEDVSPSISFSKDKKIQDGLVLQTDVSKSDDLPSEEDAHSLFPGFPLQKDPSDAFLTDMVSINVMGNTSKNNGQEKVILHSSTLQWSSVEDVSPSISFSKDKKIQDGLVLQTNVSKSDDLPPEEDAHSLFPGFPLQKDPSDAFLTDMVSINVMGNTSKNNGQEKVILHSSTLQWSSVEDVSPSISFSKDKKIQDGLVLQTDVSKSDDLPPEEDAHSLFPGFPLQKDPSDAFLTDMVSINVMGNTSKNNGQEKVILDSSTLPWSSVEDVSVLTETNLTFTELLKNGIPHDSAEVSKEERPMINRRNESSLGGLNEKKESVFVNGQLIIDKNVRKAEKLAGPIQPGNYWYDYIAGFWGVMGEPCVGIIPPFIQEFHCPMGENCAGGNTGVFVNGRELHQKDLDFLASKGLPTTTDKYYVVDISGRVLDENTGEEQDSLGKLSPAVEGEKQGSGMQVTKELAH